MQDGTPMRLGGRALDVLTALVEGRDRVITKQELLKQVWRDSTVEPNNLTVTMSALRKALNGAGTSHSPIQTVPNRGYRFVAPVQEVEDAVLAVDLAPSPRVDAPSIAVLPFLNMSGDPGQDFFGDGLAEDIISELSRFRWLTVISRNSSFSFRATGVDSREVARQFGVRYVLEGSVRRAGARVRATAQLIDAATSANVTAVRYDSTVADVFAAQDDITRAILAAIRPAIYETEENRSLRTPPDSIDAWVAYQRGMWHAARFEQPEYADARTWFRQAIALDPRFAPGYYGLGLATLHDGSGFVPGAEPDWQQRGEQLALKAVELDPRDSAAHHVLGLAHMLKGDHAGALEALDAALALNPSDAAAYHTLGATLIFTGRPAEGLDAVSTSLRLSPRDPRIRIRYLHLVLGHMFNDDPAQAEAVARAILRRWVDYPPAVRLLAIVLADAGRYEEARAMIARASALSPAPFDDYSHARMPWYSRDAHRRALLALRRAGWTGRADDR